MNFITNLFSRTKIDDDRKLIIDTLNTSFEVNENVKETYYKLLNYTIKNATGNNNYKTTVTMIDGDNINYFSTYSKII